MLQADLLPFGDAEALQCLCSRSVFLEDSCPNALNIPSTEGSWGIWAPCTLRLRTARTNLIIRSYL